MKRKISVQLSEHVVERLEAAAQRPGASRAAVVEAALDRFLDPAAETIDDATLLRRLNWMSGQLEQLERDLRIVNETVALHARYHLTIAPPLPQSEQRAACVLGLERFEVFAAQVGRRVHLGTPLMRETLDRLSATSPDLFARNVEEGAPLGAPSAKSDQDVPASTVIDAEPKLSPAAQEDGSTGGFPGGTTRQNPLR
jgi:Ribbon-helix-helix protein, copG family